MQRNINLILTAFIIVACLSLVYFLVFTDFKSEDLVGTRRTILICVLLAYATFRAIKLYRQNKQTQDEDEAED